MSGLFNLIVFLLAFPVGLLIRKLAKEELKQGKKYFRILIVSSVVLGILYYFSGIYYLAWVMAFILIVSSISYF